MSLMAAIDTAVCLQLARDASGVAINYSTMMKEPISTGGYGLADSSIDAFLQGVAQRLRVDIPPLHYAWTRTDTKRCLGVSLAILIGLIASDTAPVSSEEKK